MKIKRNRFGDDSQFYCCKCGQRGLTCYRPEYHLREKGHLKVLYCAYCNEETNHCECNNNYTYEEFQQEYLNGNFSPNGERLQTIKEVKAMIRRQNG